MRAHAVTCRGSGGPSSREALHRAQLLFQRRLQLLHALESARHAAARAVLNCHTSPTRARGAGAAARVRRALPRGVVLRARTRRVFMSTRRCVVAVQRVRFVLAAPRRRSVSREGWWRRSVRRECRRRRPPRRWRPHLRVISVREVRGVCIAVAIHVHPRTAQHRRQRCAVVALRHVMRGLPAPQRAVWAALAELSHRGCPRTLVAQRPRLARRAQRRQQALVLRLERRPAFDGRAGGQARRGCLTVAVRPQPRLQLRAPLLRRRRLQTGRRVSGGGGAREFESKANPLKLSAPTLSPHPYRRARVLQLLREAAALLLLRAQQ